MSGLGPSEPELGYYPTVHRSGRSRRLLHRGQMSPMQHRVYQWNAHTLRLREPHLARGAPERAECGFAERFRRRSEGRHHQGIQTQRPRLGLPKLERPFLRLSWLLSYHSRPLRLSIRLHTKKPPRVSRAHGNLMVKPLPAHALLS